MWDMKISLLEKKILLKKLTQGVFVILVITSNVNDFFSLWKQKRPKSMVHVNCSIISDKCITWNALPSDNLQLCALLFSILSADATDGSHIDDKQQHNSSKGPVKRQFFGTQFCKKTMLPIGCKNNNKACNTTPTGRLDTRYSMLMKVCDNLIRVSSKLPRILETAVDNY